MKANPKVFTDSWDLRTPFFHFFFLFFSLFFFSFLFFFLFYIKEGLQVITMGKKKLQKLCNLIQVPKKVRTEYKTVVVLFMVFQCFTLQLIHTEKRKINSQSENVLDAVSPASYVLTVT